MILFPLNLGRIQINFRGFSFIFFFEPTAFRSDAPYPSNSLRVLSKDLTGLNGTFAASGQAVIPYTGRIL